MAKKLGPAAPKGYIWCSDSSWVSLEVCEGCRKRKKCITYKAKLEEMEQWEKRGEKKK